MTNYANFISFRYLIDVRDFAMTYKGFINALKM